MNKKKKTKKIEIEVANLLNSLAYIEKNAIEIMQDPYKANASIKAEAIKLTILETVSKLGLVNEYEKKISKLCPRIPFPTVGQIWHSMDQREPHRGNLKIEATIIIREGDIIIKNYAIVKNLKTGRKSKIRLDRLKPGSTGFKLVRKAKGKK